MMNSQPTELRAEAKLPSLLIPEEKGIIYWRAFSGAEIKIIEHLLSVQHYTVQS